MPLEITKKSDSKIQAPKFIVDFDLDEDSNFKIPFPYPNRSFFMSITGKAGSGKSSFFLNSIKSSRPPYRVYRNMFNHVEVIMPKTSFRSVEKIFEYHDENKIHHNLTGELLEELHDIIEARSEEEESTLLIIDDFSSSLRVKDVELELFKLTSNRRHLRLSIMIIQHGILSLNPRLRKLLTHLAMFKTTNSKERQALEELLPLDSKDEYTELYNFVWDKPYEFLFVDLEKGRDKGLFKSLNLIEF